MSSIYRRGRDGYYYYQAYVYNPESKKKDKRIFHSLKTKDSLEAKTKQKELDIKYERQNYKNSNSSRLSYNFKSKPTIAFICTIAITILLFDFFRSSTIKLNTSDSPYLDKVRDSEKKSDQTPQIIVPEKITINSQINPKKENLPQIIKRKTTSKIKHVETIVTIPKYIIERVDRLSGAFNQGKLYVTINKKSSNESQRLLCKNLAKRYSEFSNIIICLYANSHAGKSLASGNGETISIEEQKDSWLAMYTFNPVEGEYFDDNPSLYLGNY